MSHSSTELLIDYWQSRIFGDRAPARASIDPTDFPSLLPQVFILGRRGPADYVFRLAGGMILDLHRMDLRGAAFTHLWEQGARLPLQTALEHARRRVEPVRLTAEAQAGPHALGLNMALMPLSNAGGEIDRFLGVYEPTAPLSHLGGLPIYRLRLVTLGGNAVLPGVAPPPEAPHLRLAAIGGARV
jgi:hypothetical protein